MPTTLLDLANARPYPGLRPFLPEESLLLFGRDEQVDQLVEKLRDARFLAVVGASGCGKSSLVRAGLIPALESGLLVRAGCRWRVATMRPVNQPMRNLAESLLKSGVLEPSGGPLPEVPSLLATLRRGPLGLVEALRESPPPPGTNVLLIVDQFEEIFRYRKQGDRREADAFVSLLMETVRRVEGSGSRPHYDAATRGAPPVYIVLTMRSDYLGDCALFNGLPEALNDSQFLTPKLTRDQRRQAIEGPAGVFGGEVEEALVRRLLNDMGPELDQLPLMQHVLMQLWCRSRASADNVAPGSGSGFVLHLADYEDEKTGGLAGALDRHAESIFGQLSVSQQGIAQVLFRCLSERDISGADESRRDIRRPTRLVDIARVYGKLKADETPSDALLAEVRSVVEAFATPEVSFLTVGEWPDFYIDVSHESILRRWNRLQKWLGEETRAAEFYRRLLESAKLFNEGRADLWGRNNLAAAKDWKDSERSAAWAARYGGHFDLATAFLRDSEHAAELVERAARGAKIAAAEKELADRELRNRRRQLALVAFALIVTIGAAFRINHERGRAIREREIANRARDIAVEERAKAKTSENIANRAREAESDAKRTALKAADDLKESNRKLGIRTEQAQRSATRAEESAAVSKSLLLAAHARSVMDKSPQLGLLLAVEAMNSPRRENHPYLKVPASEEALRIGLGMVGGRGLGFDTSVTVSAALSPDGRWSVTGGADGQVRFRDLAGDSALAPIERPGHASNVTALAFSPPVGPNALATKTRWLATMDASGQTLLWDLTAGVPEKPIAKLIGHGRAKHLVISPDGRRLLTPNYSGDASGPIAALWDLEKHPADARDRFIDLGLAAGYDPQLGWSISPDSRWLVLVRYDGSASLWDLKGPSDAGLKPIRLPALAGMPAPAALSNVVFGHGGETVALTLADGRALIWKVEADKPPEEPTLRLLHAGKPEDKYRTLLTDSDGRWIIVGAVAGANSRGGPPTNPASAPPMNFGAVPQVASDALVRLYDLREPDPTARPFLLADFPNESSLAVANKSFVVSQGDNKAVLILGGVAQVWDLNLARRAGDVTTPLRPTPLRAVERDILRSAFSPDGRWMVTSGFDNLARLWDLSAYYTPQSVLRGHDASIVQFAFSADSRHLLTTGTDRTIRLWELKPLRSVGDPETAWTLYTWPPRGGRARTATISESAEGGLGVLGANGEVAYWDLHLPRPWAKPVPLLGPPSKEAVPIGLVSYPDGRWLLSASSPLDPSAPIRDVALQNLHPDRTERGRIPIVGLENWIEFIASSTDGRWLAASPYMGSRSEGGLRFYDLRAEEPGTAVLKLPVNEVFEGFVAGGLRVVTTLDGSIHVRDLPISPPAPKDRPIRPKVGDKVGMTTIELGGRKDAPILQFDPSRSWVLVTRPQDPPQVVRFGVDGKIGAPVSLAFPAGYVLPNRYFTIAGGGRWVIAPNASQGRVLAWDVVSKENPIEPIEPFPGRKFSPSVIGRLSPDGRYYANTAEDGSVQIWNLTTETLAGRTPFRRLTGSSRKGGEDVISDFGFSDDSRWAVTLGGNSARVWDLKSEGRAPVAEVRDHGGTIISATVSRDGRWLAFANSDQAIRLWDLHATDTLPTGLQARDSGPRPSILRGAGLVTRIVIGPDGDRLMVIDGYNRVLLWDLPKEVLIEKARGIVGRNLTRAEWSRYFPDQDDYLRTFDALPEPPTIGDSSTTFPSSARP